MMIKAVMIIVEIESIATFSKFFVVRNFCSSFCTLICEIGYLLSSHIVSYFCSLVSTVCEIKSPFVLIQLMLIHDYEICFTDSLICLSQVQVCLFQALCS